MNKIRHSFKFIGQEFARVTADDLQDGHRKMAAGCNGCSVKNNLPRHIYTEACTKAICTPREADRNEYLPQPAIYFTKVELASYRLAGVLPSKSSVVQRTGEEP